MTDDLFTKADAARWLGVTPQAVGDRVRQGKLETETVNGRVLITRRGLESWKAQRADRGRKLLASVPAHG